MHEVKTIDGFQSKIAHPLMRILLDKTIDSLSISGLENIQKGESYLFISNHRDIILDSAILNVLLYEKGYGTFQTAIGSNLLSSELVSDLTKLNKNFVVKRNTGAREFYENSMILSSYIQHVIGDLKESIWIAQREGRTKDGLDKTQPGLLKMLSINCDKPVRECFRDLRITPVAISYEYDPCDVLKIPELKAISRDEKYEKAPGEDLNSILTGLTGRKGRVHIKIGKTLNKELDALADQSNINEKLKMLGEIIDRQIYLNYKIWPTNQMAFDKLENQIASSENYEGRDPEEFFNLCKERLSGANLNSPEDYNWLLNMYANPVRNYLALEEA
jgi:glycerol-3-phosphate O-acyltransferase